MPAPVLSDTQRSTVVTLLDLLCLAAIVLGAVAVFADVDRFYMLGVRVSLRNPARALIWIVGIASVRWVLWRQVPLFPALRGPLASLWPALRRWRHRFVDRAVAERIAFESSATTSDRHLRHYVVALVVFCLVPLWAQLRDLRAIPDPGDPIFSAWRLAWVAHQVVTAPGHLFDANIFYPTPLALTYSDSTVLAGLVAAPFLWAHADPLIVTNVMFVIAFPLAALAFFFAARRLTGDLRAAFIAGLLGGLAPFHFEHYSHFELQFFFWIPLAIVALLSVVTSGRLAAGAALGALVAGQCLTSMYFGAMLLTYLVPFGLAMVIGWQIRPSRRLVRALLVSAAIVTTALAVLGSAYLRSHTAGNEWSPEYLRIYSAVPADYLQANYRHAIYRTLLHDDPQPERQLFPGVMPLALGLRALLSPMPAPAAAALVAGLFAADWSFGVNGFTHPLLYRWLSPYRSMRAPARFAVLVDASLILLSAYGVRRLLRTRGSPRVRAALFAALVALVLVDVWPRLALRPYSTSRPPMYAKVSSTMILAEFPIELQANIAYAYFSTAHWARLVNGYSGYLPTSYEQLEADVRDFPSQASLDALRRRGVTHVTVNCALYRRRSSCLNAIELLDTRSDVRVVSADKWNGEDVRLYRIDFPAGASAP